jgi:DNA-directed RNA polymerase subunit RPC12/RpoP
MKYMMCKCPKFLGNGNHIYFCYHCGTRTLASKKNLNNVYCLNCGELTEYERSKLMLEENNDWVRDKKLEQAKKELLSKETKIQRHVWQCINCSNTHEQSDYEKFLTCSCGGRMIIKYTVIGKKLYNGLTGEEIAAKSGNNNPLKQWRKERGWSQEELAKVFDVSQQYISAIEAGSKSLPDSIYEFINKN